MSRLSKIQMCWIPGFLLVMAFSRWVGLRTKDKAFYYPTSTLVTGFDIIFSVAWMTMMGTLYGQMPFRTFTSTG